MKIFKDVIFEVLCDAGCDAIMCGRDIIRFEDDIDDDLCPLCGTIGVDVINTFKRAWWRKDIDGICTAFNSKQEAMQC